MLLTDEQLQTLTEQLRAGDNEPLAKLFEHYREPLKRMLRFRMDHRMRGRVDESDVLQETYLDVAQQVEAFREHHEMPLVVWLRLMTQQRMIDLHRRHLGAQMRNAANEISINRADPHAGTSACIAARLVGDLTSPSQQAQRGERLRQLEDALASMNPVDREVLALRHFEELNNNEVAEILGLQKSAASNRYVRALKRLKEVVDHDEV